MQRGADYSFGCDWRPKMGNPAGVLKKKREKRRKKLEKRIGNRDVKAAKKQ
jgi:hypothetical protein